MLAYYLFLGHSHYQTHRDSHNPIQSRSGQILWIRGLTRLQTQVSKIITRKCFDIRPCHFCMTFDLEEECYICYAFWLPYEVYIKDFSKFDCFPPVFLMVLNPPSAVENSNHPLSYIKSCILTCTFRI